MQRRIAKHKESSTEDRKPDDIPPQRQNIEAKARQDSRARHFDVEAILLVDKGQVPDFVDNEAFEAVVEDGQLCTRQHRKL